MRILILSQYFWPENFRINELAISLHSNEIEVEVLTGKPNYPSGKIFKGYSAWGVTEENSNGIKIHRVPLIPRGKGVIGLALNYVSFVVSGIIFGSWLLRGKKYDAIFVFAPSPIFQAVPAIWLRWIKKCPVLLWVQDLWPESYSSTGYRSLPGFIKLLEVIVRWIYRSVDLLLVPSKAFIPKIQSLSKSKGIVYFPNSFIENLNVVELSEIDYSIFDCEFPILFAGNIGKAQAVSVIIEAAEILRDIPEIRIVMMGEGSMREWMIHQANERGLNNLVFNGSFPVEMMPKYMSKSAALLLTLADSEILRLTIPSKIQGYLASARPIIACLNGAGANLIREARAGIGVPAENGSALAEAIRSIYAMPDDKREEMGMNGRRYYEQNFSHSKLVEQLISLFVETTRQYQGERQ